MLLRLANIIRIHNPEVPGSNPSLAMIISHKLTSHFTVN